MNAPAIVVLLTQAAVVAWFCVLGAFGGSLARPAVGPVAAIRVALWLGMGIATVFLLVLGLFQPTVGGTAIASAVVVTVVAVAVWLLVRWRRGRTANDGPALRRQWWVAVPVVALALLAFAIAHLTFGPVTNYDTGLYHLNVIQYASDYAAIPGLANLHPRLGTNVSAFDLAAFMGNTPWGADAFRMLVGVFLLVLMTDVVLRLLDGRSPRRTLPGTYLVVVALAVAVPGLMQYADAYITGSSPDTIAFALAVAAGAYLADALVTRDRTWISIAIVTVVLAASVRTQLWVLAGTTVVVLIIDGIMRRRSTPSAGSTALLWVGAAVSAVLTVVLMIRDVLFSGWLLFPMTYLPIPVDWRVPQEVADSTREWIMSWARDNTAGPDATLTSWYWLPNWIRDAASDWAILGMVGLLALALVLWLAARQIDSDDDRVDADGVRSGWRVLLLAIAPAVLAALVWFFTAPDPRFAWGPLMLVGAIPAGFALRRLSSDRVEPVLLPVAVGVLCLTVAPAALGKVASITGDPGGSVEFRTYAFGPVDVVAAVSALPSPTSRTFTLVDGNTVQIPVESDQCYMIFPLCTPYESNELRFRGPTLSDGFRIG